MRKISLKRLISLILTSALIFTFSLCLSGCAKLENSEYLVSNSFTSISIDTDTADIKFVKANDGNCKVVCNEYEKVDHVVAVENNVLTITVNDGRNVFERTAFNVKNQEVTVYLVETVYQTLTVKESTGAVEISSDFTFNDIDISLTTGAVKCYAPSVNLTKIATTTGDVALENVTGNAVKIVVTTGKIFLKNVTLTGDLTTNVSTGKAVLENVSCKNLTSTGSTGEIELKSVIANEKFTITRSTGDVKFNLCDASEIYAETNTGDIKGSLLSEKIFITSTDTGRVSVPNSVAGGRCELTTDTGNIMITIA